MLRKPQVGERKDSKLRMKDECHKKPKMQIIAKIIDARLCKIILNPESDSKAKRTRLR